MNQPTPSAVEASDCSGRKLPEPLDCSGRRLPEPLELECSLGRAFFHGFFATVFRYPDATTRAALAEPPNPTELALELGPLVARAGAAWEAFASAGTAIGEATRGLTAEGLESEWVRTFGHSIPKEFPPYEAEFTCRETFQITVELGDIAGFYRAFGLTPSARGGERPDALSTELEFVEYLAAKEAHAVARGQPEHARTTAQATRTFLRDHLLRWVPPFARRLREKGGSRLYGALATGLETWLRVELAVLGLEPPPEVGEPALLAVKDPRDEAEEALAAAEAGDESALAPS